MTRVPSMEEIIELNYHDFKTNSIENKENTSFKDLYSSKIGSSSPVTPVDSQTKRKSHLIDQKLEIQKELEKVDSLLKNLIFKKDQLLKEDKRLGEEISQLNKTINSKIPLQLLSQDTSKFPPNDKIPNPISCMQTRRKLISRKDLSFETLTGHTDAILSCCINYSNSKIISGSKDCSINVWDLKDYKLLYNIKNHQGWIKYLHCDKHLLYAGSGDKTFSITNTINGKVLKTLKGHEGGITSIYTDYSHIATSSLDKTIKFWDKTTGELLKTLVGHEQWVKSVKFLDYAVLSCGGDGIKFWDKRTSDSFRDIKCNNVNVLQFLDNEIISGTKDGELFIYEMRTGKILDQHNFGSSIHSIYYRDEDQLLIAGEQFHPILYNKNEKSIQFEFEGHTSTIHCTHYENQIMVSSSNDREIKLWIC